MGLTRIRAQQISDIDYKQAVRVITLTDITLSGGAPVEVDGVTLLVGDRVLVNGQSNAAQNGLYQVQTLGTGSNGTWVRTSDGNEDGEIQPGMVVMVTQGNEYADTPWKLITNGIIIIGTTELVFEENYSLAFGNVFANGTAVVANVVSAPLTLTAGDNISIVGNNTSKTVTIGVTGISLNSIANGTSNLEIATADGNITGTVNSNTILTITDTGSNISGYVTATGNISGDYILGNGSQLTGLPATYGNANVTDFLANGFGSNTITTTGNITGGNILGNGAGLTGINAFSNIAIDGGNAMVADSISDTLTLVAGTGIVLLGNSASDTITIAASGSGESIFATGGQMGLVTEAVVDSEDLGLVTQAVTESYDLGSLAVDGIVTNENIVNGTLTGNKFASDFTIVTTGNITAGNLNVTGTLGFTSADVDTITANVANINSQLNMTGNIIPTANATYALGSPTNVWQDLYLANSTIYLGAATISASGANLVLPATVQIGDATLTAQGGNLALPENISATTVTVSGNISSGNISTSGRIAAATGTFTGNVTAVSIHPATSATHDLGTSNLRWRTVFTSDLDLNNGVGDWTIVEGEDDLFLYNNKKNRVYKFALIEIDPDQATPKIDGLK